MLSKRNPLGKRLTRFSLEVRAEVVVCRRPLGCTGQRGYPDRQQRSEKLLPGLVKAYLSGSDSSTKLAWVADAVCPPAK